jgi:phosphoglycolate phosphatase
MNIRLVIFDFDGTMADTRHNIVLTMQRVMRELGMPVADEETCASTIGLPLKDCFRKIFPELTDDGAEHCAETYRQIFFANAKSLVPPPARIPARSPTGTLPLRNCPPLVRNFLLMTWLR